MFRTNCTWAPQAWARGGGKRGHLLLPSGNVGKCFFVLQVLSTVSLDKEFIHYFEKMLSVSGEPPLDPARRLPSFRPPLLPSL